MSAVGKYRYSYCYRYDEMMNVTTYTDGVSSGNVDASVVEVLEHEIEISITN